MRIAYILGWLFILTTSLNAFAGEPDPLWLKAIADYKESKAYVAKEIDYLVVNTKDEQTRSTVLKMQLSGWEKGQAQYAVVSEVPNTNNASKFIKAFKTEEIFGPLEKEFFSPTSSFKRRDGQQLEGKPSVLFEISEMVGKMLVWVDPTTGRIQKRTIEMSVAFSFEGSNTDLFQVDQNGKNLVVQSETKANIKIPFKKSKIEIKADFSQWVPNKA